MKNLYILILFTGIIGLQSCRKPGKIKVQNNISNVKIQDVKWGDHYLSYELLPGETSSKISISYYDEKLPANHKVSFTMSANQKSIYLETVEEYLLDEDQEILIVLSDSTEVKNPNV